MKDCPRSEKEYPMSDIRLLRQQFPMFSGPNPPAYLDSAASSQKPKRVIDRVQKYDSQEHCNVHRGVYKLAEQATSFYEDTREKVASFVGNVDSREIIFTSGTTESINLVANTWGDTHVQADDEILLTIAEHHSNIVPWHILAKRKGAKVKFIPLDENLRLDMKAAEQLISRKTKVVAFAHVSNVLGVIHPVNKLVELAKSVGAISVIDGAQSVPHFDVDVRKIGCDFYSFSGHKMCGPTGTGVLYGRMELLDAMPPYKGGGEMIAKVTTEGATWAELPQKFEAGTPHIAGVIGLGEAIDFLQSFDRKAAFASDLALGRRCYEGLKANKSVSVFLRDTSDWVGIVSFHHNRIHPHDIAHILDAHSVCVRAGHHCAQPLMSFLNVAATTRVSPYIYNNETDLQKFFTGLAEAERLF